jgi:hypothetical protein
MPLKCHLSGHRLRIALVAKLNIGVAEQFARAIDLPITEVQSSLRQLREVAATIFLGGTCPPPMQEIGILASHPRRGTATVRARAHWGQV